MLNRVHFNISPFQQVIQPETFNSNNQITVALQNSSSTINNLDVDLDGVTGFLLNWVVNFFEGDIANTLESELSSALEDEIPDLIEDVLQSFEIAESFDVMGSTLNLVAEPSSVFAFRRCAASARGASIGGARCCRPPRRTRRWPTPCSK